MEIIGLLVIALLIPIPPFVLAVWRWPRMGWMWAVVGGVTTAALMFAVTGSVEASGSPGRAAYAFAGFCGLIAFFVVATASWRESQR